MSRTRTPLTKTSNNMASLVGVAGVMISILTGSVVPILGALFGLFAVGVIIGQAQRKAAHNI